MRTGSVLRAGVHPATFYAMRRKGLIEPLARGVYRLAGAPTLSDPDLALVATKAPRAVVCLISALHFHDLTTQIPHEVCVAIGRGEWAPRLSHLPIRVFRFTGDALTEGVETHVVDGANVRVYSPEKTLADCFKFRNRIGMDTVIEALRLYRERKRVRVDDLLRYASICRVARVMRPYLEAAL
jgi:predicted transcriptional regulator of viral defense system